MELRLAGLKISRSDPFKFDFEFARRWLEFLESALNELDRKIARALKHTGPKPIRIEVAKLTDDDRHALAEMTRRARAHKRGEGWRIEIEQGRDWVS